MISLPDKLRSKLDDRAAANALRLLPPQSDLIDFTSNDYLGFARDQSLYHRADSWLASRGLRQNGSTGSRLLSGNLQLHTEVEEQLAGFYESPAALLFNSGYVANLALISCLPQRGDLVLYDQSVHASIREGLQLCQAKTIKFKHNDLSDLERALQRNRQGTVYLVTESVYSMDGSVPDMEGLNLWVQAHKVRWILDEAHASGVKGPEGRGLGHGLNVFARLVTFGKAMGCHGAAVLGSEELKAYLVNFARSLIYTTSLPPHALAAIAVVHQALQETAQIDKLQQQINYFKNTRGHLGLDALFLPSNTAIQSCVVEGNQRAKQTARALQEAGFDVRPILAPTVPKGSERLRFCIHAYNTKSEIDSVLKALSELI